MKKKTLLLTLLIILIVSGCSQPSNSSNLPQVVVSTSIIADVAEQVSGGLIELEALLPAGVDPHSYQPTPQDMAKINEADLVLINGYGLEEFLSSVLEDPDLKEKIVVVSDGIEIEDGDPHVWLDPNNVVIWVQNINIAFSQLVPEHTDKFDSNASMYIDELTELDEWIFETISVIPEEDRLLVSDHLSLEYFAHRYEFELSGTITHSASSLAEPSAQEFAELIDLIVELGIPALFIGHETNPELAESLTSDLDIKLVELHIGSLSHEDGPAVSYLELMRFNVEEIISALSGN